jgi:6-phosphofructokinase 1
MVAEGKLNRMTAWQERGVTDVPLEEVCIGPRSLDPNGTLIKVARGLGIYVGESEA